MAAAVMAGLNPAQGLYAGMIASPVGAGLSSSAYMMITTTSAMALAAGGALASLPAEQKLAGAVALTVMIGVCQIAAGLARLGFVARYISNAVMTGFLTGIAVLVVISQLGELTGLAFRGHRALHPLEALVRLDEVVVRTLAVGLATIALVLALERTRIGKMAMLLALIAVSVAVPLAGWDDVALVGTSAPIPRALPDLHMIELARVPALAASALAIAIIGLVQGAGVSQSYPNPDGGYPDVSRDFLAQGAANLAAGALGGMPVGGSAGSTALNVSAGAATRWSNVFSGVFLAVGVVTLGALIERIPMAALAGLLVIAGIGAVNPGRIAAVWHTGRSVAGIMLFTFVATLILPVRDAVFLSVAVSFLLAIVREAEQAGVVEVVLRDGANPREQPAPLRLPSRAVTVLMPHGSLFFAGARTLEAKLPDPAGAERAAVVLLLRGYQEVGSTFIGIVRRYHETLAAGGGRLILAGVSPGVEAQLLATGTTALLGEGGVVTAGRELLAPALTAYRAAQAWLAMEGKQ
jgi:SulP family sulfate permease